MTTPPDDDAAQYRAREAAEHAAPAVRPNFQPMTVQPHSAGLAVAASFFVPGLGSMLNERVGKGVLIVCCYAVAWISCLFLIGFVLAPAVWIWGMVAANNDAHSWNRAHGILS